MKHTKTSTTIGPHRYTFQITKTLLIAAKQITNTHITLNTTCITQATNQTHDPTQQITLAFHIKSLNTHHTNQHNNLQPNQWAIHHNNTIYTIDTTTHTTNTTTTHTLTKNPLLNHKAIKCNLLDIIKKQLNQTQ